MPSPTCAFLQPAVVSWTTATAGRFSGRRLPVVFPEQGTKAARRTPPAWLKASKAQSRRSARPCGRAEQRTAARTCWPGRALGWTWRPRRIGARRLASRLVKPCPLDGRRRHLGEMDEGGLVVRGEAPILLVEELDGAELAAVQGGQRCGEPSPKRTIAAREGERGRQRVARRPSSPSPRFSG